MLVRLLVPCTEVQVCGLHVVVGLGVNSFLAQFVLVSSFRDVDDIILLFGDLDVDLHVAVWSACQIAIFFVVVIVIVVVGVAARTRVSLKAIYLVIVVVFITVGSLVIVGHLAVHGTAVRRRRTHGQTVLVVEQVCLIIRHDVLVIIIIIIVRIHVYLVPHVLPVVVRVIRIIEVLAIEVFVARVVVV